MDEQRNTAPQNKLDVDTGAKKNNQKKWIIGGVAAAALIATFAVVVFGFIFKRPSNFLNIKWDTKPKDAVETITKKIEKAGVEYRILVEDYNKVDIDLAADPFFGQTDVSPGLTVAFKNDRLTSILFMWLGETEEDYESVVRNVAKQFGKPESTEINETMRKLGGGRKSVWHLKSTDIRVELTLGMVMVEFSPSK